MTDESKKVTGGEGPAPEQQGDVVEVVPEIQILGHRRILGY
jgi:hypothetical protein